MSERDIEYVLPLRRHDTIGEAELVRYLEWLSGRVEVTVVDGSASDLFAGLARVLPAEVRHLAPRHPGLNGKARGVLTGVEAARHELIVLADDDIRYDEAALAAVADRLSDADLVRPQNLYSSYPWHARWDTARMLVARAFGGDYGGTLGVRRSTLQAAGGYSADVLFENLELERTVRCVGGKVDVARDVYVLRRPPTARHFLGQRVRQAYDDLAQPGRLLTELAILPLVSAGVAQRKWPLLAALAAAVVGVAEVGRRRDGGARRIPVGTTLWAPLWILERAVSVWLALIARLRGGIVYAGARIPSAGTPLPILRRRIAGMRSASDG
ncbi:MULTISPECIES: glycosyltransferase [unclassified Microbacterium]|uniref:glycosyltransferase n=1 Tax=unclassified Microbacterium TaxID=2609290 RepID=UPI00214CC2F3|nr:MULTISPECIES: glycosyltransferase [unclassified Microbacterium]MCR2808709.1 glycosyltransferase [Microbacterium sp. zg.B185]WIM18860.1 glycosyltransferase [Microbacterium sp. zg-B185]